MNLKNLFKNSKAVSPVIGVVLMVAITVILAAAIGSSVFGEGTSDPAPQANLNIKADTASDGSSTAANVIIEHLGGDPINFADGVTKVVIAIEGESTEVSATGLGVMDVGKTDSLELKDTSSTPAAITDAEEGTTVNIKIIDVATNQLICDKDVRF